MASSASSRIFELKGKVNNLMRKHIGAIIFSRASIRCGFRYRRRLLGYLPTEASFERDVVNDLMLKAEAVDGERHSGVDRLLTL